MSRFDVAPMTPADYVDATQGRAPWEPSSWEAGCYRLDHGCAWTARVDGAIAAVGGLVCLWPGVADAWLCLTPVGQAHPIFVGRTVARRLVQAIAAHTLRRVQADIRDHDTDALALVTYLGFQEEGIMRRYGPNGEDFIRCARVAA